MFGQPQRTSANHDGFSRKHNLDATPATVLSDPSLRRYCNTDFYVSESDLRGTEIINQIISTGAPKISLTFSNSFLDSLIQRASSRSFLLFTLITKAFGK